MRKRKIHFILSTLIASSLILQACNINDNVSEKTDISQVTDGVSTQEISETSTTEATTVIETTIQETTETTTEETTIPTEPIEESPKIFEHNGVLLNLPLKQEMPDDTSIDQVMDPQFVNSWDIETDPIRAEVLKQIYDSLLNPVPVQDENGEAVKFTEEEAKYYYGTYDSFVGRYQFVVDLSDWSLQIGTEELGSLVSEILFTEPRFFAYEWLYIFNHDAYDYYDAKFTFFPTEKYNSVNPMEAIEADYREVVTEAKEIASKIMAVSKNQWHRIRLAHDYLIEYLDYDPTPPDDNLNNNVYKALLGPDKFTKCLGYAQANALILASMGIEVIPVTGHIIEGYHEWNYVKIDDEWYAIDVTFDGSDRKDPERIISKSGSIEYFLKGSDFINITHTPILQVNISDVNYIGSYEAEGRYFDNAEDFVDDLTSYLDAADLSDDTPEVYEFAYSFDLMDIEGLINEALDGGENSGIEIVIDWELYQNVCKIFVGTQSL